MPPIDDAVRVTLLGTGTSTGIPVIGCTCRVCLSGDPRDKRLRCACHVEVDGIHLLIDAGPDLRTQALHAGLTRIDAVLLTHHHFDHVVGLDDLRPFFFDNAASIPCYAHPDTAGVLRDMFSYIFSERTYPGVANLRMEAVVAPFEVKGRYDPGRSVTVTPIEAFHGRLPLYGYRIGRFAYLTDTSRIPEESLALLKGLDVLVLDALRHEPHPAHFTIEQAIDVARAVGARQTYFIHMTHHILHAEEEARLPAGMALAYDGLTFDVSR
ncbi:MAG: MBL fold metallo-hydrolase [Rhodothermales bacterium]